MPRIAVLALVASLLLALPLAGQEDGPPKIFPYETRVETLDNGLEVILVPMSSGGLVAYWTIVRTGARDEWEPNRTGFAHFFEHMMFRGTERFPADVYNAKITEIGADANAFTTDDFTGYHLSITKDDLETVMDLESDRFKNLSYPKELFETEAGAVYGEYRKNRSFPFFLLFEEILATAFEEHTYGHSAMGYEEDIKLMPKLFDYSRSFFDRYYRPENTVLMIVGDIDPEATIETVKEHYGDWQPGYVAPKIAPEPEQKAERRVNVDYPGRSLPIVSLAYKVPAYDPDDRTYMAINLLGELYFGATSALHKKLVLDEQVVEFVAFNFSPNRDPNLATVLSRIKDPSKVDYVIAEVDRTIAEAQATAVDLGRLADAKSRFKYGFLMNLDTPSNVAGALARIVAVTGGIDAVDRAFVTTQAITAEDVQKAAQSYLQPTRRTVAILRGAS